MVGDACLVVVSAGNVGFVLGVLTSACLVLGTSRAEAFTAVFAANNDKTTQVIEHRMAVAILPGELVLWDQARWSTSSAPTELAWVAPVPRTATTSVVTSDAWFAALDASTQPIIYQPPDFGPAAGCSLTPAPIGARFLGGCASDSAYGRGPDKIAIRSSAVAGPVETITIPGTNPNALNSWLTSNGFTIGPNDGAAITEVANAGFDFVVMRLRPNCGEDSTRVFRVSLPATTTAAPTIPTRLMSIGGSRSMAMTLYTIADRRQTVLGSTNTSINLSELLWDERENTSNYAELRDRALSGNSGRSWLTEYADIPDRSPTSSSSSSTSRSSSSRVTPSFFELYPGICGAGVLPSNTQLITPTNVRPGPCSSTNPSPDRDSGANESDAGSSDGSLDSSADGSGDAAAIDASIVDAGADGGDVDDEDAGRTDAGPSFPPAARDTCASPDDLTVGLRGLDLNRVFLTRLRGTFLTFASSSVVTGGDIALSPDPSGGTVTNGLQAVAFEEDKSDKPNRSAACVSTRSRGADLVAPLIGLAVASIAIARRRQRRP